MIEKVSIKEYCQSCGAELHGKFCSECGEKKFNKSDLAFKKILLQAVDVFTHFDSKILKSVKLLITKPGLLGKEYCSGVKVKYSKPLRLFFIINVLYFLAMSFGYFNTFNTPLYVHLNTSKHTAIAIPMVEQKIAKEQISLADYTKKFDAKVNVFSKTLIILIVPLFAFVLHIVFINKKKMYGENFIFSLNFLSWLLLVYIFFINIPVFILRVFGDVSLLNDDIMSFIIFAAVGTYLFFGVMRFYEEKRWIGILKCILLPYLFYHVLNVYRFILFLITYYST